MASATERRVRIMRLRGRDESVTGRGVILLNDAFRTAAMPGDDGRLYIFRSLALGSFRAGVSPGTLALLIEARMRSLRAEAVYAASPDASTASAVYFHDPVEPVCMLAAHLVRNKDPDAWFWSLAVPGWQPGMPRTNAIRAFILGLAETESGIAAVAALTDRLLSMGDAEVLLDALQYADTPALMRLAGWQVPSPAAQLLAFAAPDSVWHPISELPYQHQATLRRALMRWGADDLRSFFLACVLQVAAKPGFCAPRSVPAEALKHLAHASKAAPVRAAADVSSEVPEVVSPDSSSTENTQARLVRNETEHGGLFFLLTILQQLGIGDVIEEPELAGRVLALCAQRLRISHRDLVWHALPRRDWTERQVPDPVAARWLSTARRWCRRNVRTGLVELTARRAVVTVTRTHLNVVFRHIDADIRIRRCGLDIDPGWLPWFGRVVRFYYADDEEWHAS